MNSYNLIVASPRGGKPLRTESYYRVKTIEYYNTGGLKWHKTTI